VGRLALQDLKTDQSTPSIFKCQMAIYQLPNRYYTLASVQIYNNNNEPEQYINFTDLQMAYLWIKDFMVEKGGDWSELRDFPDFATDLDHKVVVNGVRFANNTVYSIHYQLSVFYGHVAL